VDHKLLLAKCVTLLYKESLLKESDNNSRILIEEAIKKIQPREIGLGLGGDKDVVQALKETVHDLLLTPNDQWIDRTGLLQRIRINVGDNDKLYQAFEKGLMEDQTGEDLLKSVISIRKTIDRHLRELKVSEVLTGASASWNFNRDKITDTHEFLTAIWKQLEPLASLKTKEDSAVINEIRLGDTESVLKVVSNFHVSVTENRIYRTGWQGLNRMLQGGIRPGEFWIWPASLQHKYKTGFSQSTFNQIARYNKPMSMAPNKKPALVAITFEDTMEERFQFIFKQMMFTETGQTVDISNYSVEEIQNYVLTKLSVNGYEVFFYRINPSEWTYIDLFNKIVQLENSGYAIEFCMIDYLEKLPTTGCIHSGPAGNDLLDLFNRVRVFFNSRGIACITPHQLSSESKRLIRGTVTEDKFVEALIGRGYYKGSSQLDQIPDGILLTHLFKRGNKSYLAIQRDRHRINTIVDEKYKLMYLEFDSKMPLADDLYGEDKTLSRLPPYAGNANDDLFNFDAI